MSDFSSEQNATALDATRGGSNRRVMVALIASITASSACIGMVIPLLAVSMERMGISGTIIGLNSSMPALAALVALPFLPKLLPLLPVRWFMPGCLLFSIVCLLFYGLFPNVWVWFPLRFLNGLAIAGLFAVSETWINVIAEERWRGRLIGVYATFFALGFALGPILFRFTGIDGFLPYLAACGVLLLALPPLLLIPKTPPKELGAKPTVAMFRLLYLAPAALLAVLAFGALEAEMLTLLSVYALRSGLDEYTSILTITVFAIGNMVFPIPLGYLADIIDRRLVLLLCALCGLVGALLLPFIITMPMVFFSVLFLFGGMVTGMYTVGLTLIGQTFRGANITAANALFLVLYSLGALVGPIVGGVAMDIWDPHGLAVSMILISGSYALLLGWRILQIRRGSR